MKRIIKTILLAILIFHVQSIFAQDEVLKPTSTEQSAPKIKVEGIVCDAETGERLPYATIKVENESRGTITNHEGEFVLQANATDVLCVHFVGYDGFSIRASEMPKTIQLNPCQNVLSEVTIFVGNNMLLKTNKLLSKQFKKHEMESSQYFFRLNTTYQTLDVTEGFMTALSMGNLRSVSIVKGYHARKKTKGEDSFRISDMNFHHMLELGPWMNGTEFWARITSPMKPALNDAYLQKHYDLTATKLKDNQGKFYYLIHIDRRTRKTYPDGIVTGKLYIDAETLLPLRFDGQVEDINLVSGGFLNRQITPLDIHVALNFDNARGYTEVASIMMVDGALCTNHKGTNPIYDKCIKAYDKNGKLTGVMRADKVFVSKDVYDATKSVLKFDACKLTFKNLCIAYYQGYKCGCICTSLRAYMATEKYMNEHAADFARLADIPLTAALAKENHLADIHSDRLIEVYSASKSAERMELPTPKEEKTEEPKAEIAPVVDNEVKYALPA